MTGDQVLEYLPIFGYAWEVIGIITLALVIRRIVRRGWYE